MAKMLTFEGLTYYTNHLMEYIDQRIAENNKVVIVRECPCCGAHDFKIGDNLYECAYCGSKFQYQTLYDKGKLDE